MADSPFPSLLAVPLLEDKIFARAYEAVSPRGRACCKLLIARLHACLGEERLEDDSRSLRLRQGFKLVLTRNSVDWALLLWDVSCSSPSRILAALMPAVLAGVPHILVCQVYSGSEVEFSAPVLAALDLAGQEAAASLSAEDALSLVRKLESCGTGCMAVLGDAPWTADIMVAARACGIRAWNRGTPRIVVCPSASGVAGYHEHKETMLRAPDYGMLRFAQPDAEIVSMAESRADTGVRYDCIVAGVSRIGYWLSHAPLVLTPGHEWFWIWPELGLEFFMRRRYGIAE